MTRFILKRIGLGLITLWLLSVLVFFLANVLPGNVARRVLGPFASPEAVAQLNHQLGTDKPLITQYLNQMKGYLSGDMGTSVSTKQPISDVRWLTATSMTFITRIPATARLIAAIPATPSVNARKIRSKVASTAS